MLHVKSTIREKVSFYQTKSDINQLRDILNFKTIDEMQLSISNKLFCYGDCHFIDFQLHEKPC